MQVALLGRVRPRSADGAFFNDAGVGKDNPGIVAVDMRRKRGVAVGIVCPHVRPHRRFAGHAGQPRDNRGTSYVDEAARNLGLAPGTSLRQALTKLVRGQGRFGTVRTAAERTAPIRARLRTAQTEVIRLKEPESSCAWDLSKYESKAKGRVCVYVVGHGTETSGSVGNCTAKDLAKTLDTISESMLSRVSFVACHSGGDGNSKAPHRFVSDFWDYAKHFVEEVTGYTGEVHLNLSRWVNTGKPEELPKGAVRYESWSGEEWWVKEGTGRKTVSHDHDEGANRRKIYISAKSGTTSRGWTGKL